MQFGILGPLEVVAAGRRLELGAHRQRALLAIFLLHAGEVISLDRLIDQLWGDAPPNTATGSLQAYVSNLRRVLEPGRGARQPASILVTEAPGYRLNVDPDTIDANRFERLTAEGRRSLVDRDPRGAIARFDEALALWRGEALVEFRFEPFVSASIARLEELHAAADEDRLVAQLAIDDHTGAVLAAERLVAEHPLRERLRSLQMLALYRCGRQVEALRAYDAARRFLAEELGVQPGAELQAMFQQVLEHDPKLDASALPQETAPIAPLPTVEQAPAGPSFVGRAEMLAAFDAALTAAWNGQPRVMLIGGEAGIGKTRLAEIVSVRAQSRGMAVAWGRCHDDDGMPPLWPLVQVLASLQTQRPRAGVSLAELVGIDERLLDVINSEHARYRLYDATRGAIERCSDCAPLMIVIDDLQWADASTLRLLSYLAVELQSARVLLVGTFHEPDPTSSGPLATALADLGRRPIVERHTMTGLTQRDVAELVQLDSPIEADSIDAVAAELHRRTDGNAFFLTELVRLLVSERTLQDAGRTTAVPLAVSDVIRRRLRRLPDDVHAVLGVAAVIGPEFELEVLHRAAGLSPDNAFELLEAAVMARVVIETRPDSYRFSHGLVRDTLYSDLTPGRRARLHAKVADAMEIAYAADVQRHVSQLAHHVAAAGEAAAAARYSELAAEQAEAGYAYDEAVAHWRVAIGHTDEHAYGKRARLLVRLGAAYRGAGDALSSAGMHDLALAAAEASGDLDLLAEAALAYGEVGLWQVRPYGTVDDRVVRAISKVLDAQPGGDSRLRARLLAGLATALYYEERERDRGRDLTREAVAVARRCNDRQLLAETLVELLVLLDDQPDRNEQLRVAAELETLRGDDLPFETTAAAAMRLARLRLAAGDAASLERDIAEIARRAEDERHAVVLLWVTWAQASVAFLRGDLAKAEALAALARDRHEQAGIWGAAETFALHMTYIWREQDRLAEFSLLVEPLLEQARHPGARKILALYRLERGVTDDIAGLIGDQLIMTSRDFTWLSDLCLTAELCSTAGINGADELYAQLLPFDGQVATMDGPYICLGAISYYLGLLAQALGHDDAAARHLTDAVALNDAVGAVPWSVRSRYHLALASPDKQRSRTLLADALDAAGRHGLLAMSHRLRQALATGQETRDGANAPKDRCG